MRHAGVAGQGGRLAGGRVAGLGGALALLLGERRLVQQQVGAVAGDRAASRTASVSPEITILRPARAGPSTCSGLTPRIVSPRWRRPNSGPGVTPSSVAPPRDRTHPAAGPRRSRRRSAEPRWATGTGAILYPSRSSTSPGASSTSSSSKRTRPATRMASVTQLAQARRAVDGQRPLARAQVERLEQARQPEPVVGVEVGQEHLGQLGQPDRAARAGAGSPRRSRTGSGRRRGAPAPPAARAARSGSSRRCRRRRPRGPSRPVCQSRTMSSKLTRPRRTVAMPMVCAGARRRSVGLPGLKI